MTTSRWRLSLLPAVCEELAFRGFMLSGLRRRFRPWTAILLSGFLYALYQMNVFQFVPHFLVGVVLALLVTRTGSVLSAMLFHGVWNSVLILPFVWPESARRLEAVFADSTVLPAGLVLGCLLLAAPVLMMLRPRSVVGTRPRQSLSSPLENPGMLSVGRFRAAEIHDAPRR